MLAREPNKYSANYDNIMTFSFDKTQLLTTTDTESFLVQSVHSLCEGNFDYISNAANISAVIFEHVPNINWVGFYFLRNNSLYLGPFQGKVACTLIPIGKGVCGTAVAEQKIQRIDNVHEFPGHIACDAASNSELVIPLWVNNSIIGVLDIDSPLFSRFTETDENIFRQITDIFSTYSDFSFFHI